MGIRSRSAVAAVLAAPLLLGGCALLGSQAGGTFASIGDAPDCTFGSATGESLEARIAALRAIGFFADRADLTDAQLADEVEQGIVEWWGEVDAKDPLIDLVVADQDHRRAWWEDIEADVGMGNTVYADTLAAWSAISEGAFLPTDIHESWASDTGPVTVSFTLDGTPETLTPAYEDDWIDLNIIPSINELIAASGRRFMVANIEDQLVFVAALTPEEQASLESRGWCFAAF